MVGKLSPKTKPVVRFAEPPWNEQSAPWRQIDAQLPQDHLAREIRQAMAQLDLTALYDSYTGRGKAPHRPDLMLAIVLFELQRGQRQPSQWCQDTHENCALCGPAHMTVDTCGKKFFPTPPRGLSLLHASLKRVPMPGE
jgi:hypothetical protein